MAIWGYRGSEQVVRAALGFCLSEIGAHGDSWGPIYDGRGAETAVREGANTDHVPPTPCPRAHGMAIWGYLRSVGVVRAALGFCLSEIDAHAGSGG